MLGDWLQLRAVTAAMTLIGRLVATYIAICHCLLSHIVSLHIVDISLHRLYFDVLHPLTPRKLISSSEP